MLNGIFLIPERELHLHIVSQILAHSFMEREFMLKNSANLIYSLEKGIRVYLGIRVEFGMQMEKLLPAIFCYIL